MSHRVPRLPDGRTTRAVWQPSPKRDIHDIKTWPPGTFILYDNREECRKRMDARIVPHQGIGLVVANDGEHMIRVVWGGNCREVYLTYDVRHLNDAVIFHVG